ncbi:hypothetical protein SAMD00019534_108840 [Acytostelium subglobosum LB1]|uniref:hypothetical protein n=1 Tax=Acytostelium subglobosum LB1 TaxID=1410327 RepID=UPI000644EAD6|nr:hypothetical protein SAMD00019534_108840 [Acytostelium subglobosum LB1]GAM27708.1 hypothetical protein SAMD00019534_108840 [Acytostelium subglobosum LB1]|eukprot:XP_012749367.1 hypothetical protein SAMD00019534_108840 [Acytostelium subglobosum LB1]
MMSSAIASVFRGTIIHSLELETVQILHNAALGVSHLGSIVFVRPDVDTDDKFNLIQQEYGFESNKVVNLGNKFLIPGFIDTHAHAPQYHNAGTGTDLPLLKWLEKYTFPVESKFRDLSFAKNVYTKVVDRMLKNGTTTCCYYATIHLDASLLLADIVTERGQRGFIGKVCMDRHSPDHYVETTEDSIRNTRQFVEQLQARGNPLVQPIVTPRFAPSCTDSLMHDLGKLARERNTLVQSHISENLDEVQWVKSLYPNLNSYAEVYKHFDLLTNKTIMAHCVHLSDQELDLFKQQEASIAHCPQSNFTLGSGALDVRKVLSKNIKIGLGSDVSGGYSASLLSAVRDTTKCSNAVLFGDRTHKTLGYEAAFYLATVGGSKVVCMEDKLGNFVEGKYFDAQVIDPYVQGGPFDVFADDTPKDIFQKFIFLGDDRNVNSVYVNGKKVI